MPLEEKTEEQLNIEESKRKAWNPTEKQKERIKMVFDAFDDMKLKRDQTYPQFNDRTLKEFIDDSEKRLNAYVLDRASQGKEDWQSNFATRAYANKAKALLAATSRRLPDMKFKAVNNKDQFDRFGADIMKNLVKHSYQQGNPQEEMFFLAWSNVGKGTVLSYEGFEKQHFTKKRIVAFDMLTGDVEEEVMEQQSQGEPVSFEIPIMDLYVRSFYIRDIQKQPDIIWATFYSNRDTFLATWGKFPNAKFVKDVSDMTDQDQDTYFHERYKETIKQGKGYLVLRYMSTLKDIYRVVVNGVEIYNGPMLWVDITRKNFGKKVYPIAKTIFEPFANTDFFYGNSLPNSAMGEGDTINTLFNTALDKEYRSMVPPLLIGMPNKDLLDLEDEIVAGDTKVYVDDINQVKEMPIKGVSDSTLRMIDLVGNQLDLTTLDPQQQGSAQKYVTARAAIAADERARQLKGIFFMFMESLWLQKMRLRVPNILLSYTRPTLKKIIGEEDAVQLEERYRRFNVENAELSDGVEGTLSVEFLPREEINVDALRLDVEAEEARSAQEGISLERVILPYGYLENLSFDMELIPESLWESSKAINMAMAIEKIELVATSFPEIFKANRDLFFKDLVQVYNDDPGKYKMPPGLSVEDEMALDLATGKRRGGGLTSGSQRISDLTGADRNNRIGSLTQQ